MSNQDIIISKRRGFSLVELLVVIATMTILIGSTIAGFSWMRQTKQAESAAEEIKNQLVLARSTALAEGKDVEVTFTNPPDNNKVVIKVNSTPAKEIFNKTFSNFKIDTKGSNQFKFIGTDASQMGQIDKDVEIDIKRDNKTEATLKINKVTGNVEIE